MHHLDRFPKGRLTFVEGFPFGGRSAGVLVRQNAFVNPIADKNVRACARQISSDSKCAPFFIEQILQTQRMEHGSLSIIRPGPNGPYYSLNSWENGKNCCRYLPQHKVPEVQQAIEGYHKYQ